MLTRGFIPNIAALGIALATPLALMALTAVAGLLTGKINTRGLLDDKQHGGVSATRVQMLIFTIIASLDFAAKVALDLIGGEHTTLPAMDLLNLTLLGGSQSLYLLVKLRPLLPSLRRR